MIHGLGVFADETIPKGTLIWQFTPGFDQIFTKQQITGFPKLLRTYLDTYAWKNKKTGLYCFGADNAKYFNHADSPNTISQYEGNDQEVTTRASRDIAIGEELTSNYSEFE